MSLENKKFLNATGVSRLWENVVNKINEKVASVSNGNNGIEIGGTTTAPTVSLKLSAKTGNALSIQTGAGEEGLFYAPAAEKVYRIVKLQNASEGAIASYQLATDGTPGGTIIDIPKDMVVSGGEVKTVSIADTPYTGAVVGDKYIELTLANKANDKLYIPANSLVEYVTSGSQTGDMIVINIDNNHQVTATITDGTITKTKLDSSVQTSLGLADSAVQSITTGDATSGNGTIKVDGNAVSVYGLGSAAYTASTAYDAAGSADAVLGTNSDNASANTVYGAKAYADSLANNYDAAGSADAVYNAIIALTNTEIDTACGISNS